MAGRRKSKRLPAVTVLADYKAARANAVRVRISDDLRADVYQIVKGLASEAGIEDIARLSLTMRLLTEQMNAGDMKRLHSLLDQIARRRARTPRRKRKNRASHFKSRRR